MDDYERGIITGVLLSIRCASDFYNAYKKAVNPVKAVRVLKPMKTE